MNINIKQSKVKIILEEFLEKKLNLSSNSSQYVEISEQSSYECFIDQLNNLGILLMVKHNYLIFLVHMQKYGENGENGEKLEVTKDSFDKVKELLFTRTSDEDAYLTVNIKAEDTCNVLFNIA